MLSDFILKFKKKSNESMSSVEAFRYQIIVKAGNTL